MIGYYVRVLRLWFYFIVIKMLPGSQLKSVIHHILPNGGTKIPSQKNIEPESDQFATCNYQLIGNRKKTTWLCLSTLQGYESPVHYKIILRKKWDGGRNLLVERDLKEIIIMYGPYLDPNQTCKV